MGACCGKPRHSDGYVLGGSNTSSNASAPPGKTTAARQQQVPKPSSGGNTLGASSPSSPPRAAPGDLSASALAAQKRAEAAENRGVQQGGGKLAKKLAEQNKQSPFAAEEAMPEQMNSMTPMTNTAIKTTLFLKNLLIYSTSSIAIVFFIWSGTHAYLEQYKCPSPDGLSKRVRNCLHGAWIREEVAPDPDTAELYLQSALEFARSELETLYRNKYESNKSNNSLFIDKAFLEIEMDKSFVEIQNRLARYYSRMGQDERAATIWTRLWKLSEKKNPRSSSESSPSSSSSSSWFGASERPLITPQDGTLFAKQAADCWMRLGEYEFAEEALGWTLNTIESTPKTADSSSAESTLQQVGLLSTLGALYARQSKFEYALSLFVKALQTVQEHRAQSTSADINESNMWYCREAILTNSIGEALYGAASFTGSVESITSTLERQESTGTGKSWWNFWSSSSSTQSKKKSTAVKSPQETQKEEEALGWIQKAISMAKEKSGQHRDCDECSGLGLNNLGLISEMNGNTGVALQQFKEAITHATKANDYVGIESYTRNIARVKEAISLASEQNILNDPSNPLPSSLSS
ncbi:hypothetical protein BGZ76_009527 [Entomortierella beljakovae]|nr:hypothetical protein BGZ76_009527 [Entomortierella beljakovae]